MCAAPKGMAFRFGLKTGTILWPFIAHFGSQRSHERVCRGQGWRSGESTRLPAMWPGFKSRRRRHMWVELLVCCQEPITLCCWFFSFASRGFSSGSPVFPSPQKPTLPNSIQFDLERTDTFKRVHMNS